MALYKEYEGLLRAENTEPKAVEDAAPEAEANRLRMCRQFRNYFAHVPDPGFLEPTVKMFSFLQGRVDSLKQKGQAAKKYVKKPEACMLKPSQKVSEAFQLFCKLKRTNLLVDEGDHRYSLLSIYDMSCMKGSAKVGVCKTKAVKPYYCSPLDPAEILDPDAVILCTDDGTAAGKLLGQVFL